MDKMKFESPNLTANNAAQIAAIFPGAVAEGKIYVYVRAVREPPLPDIGFRVLKLDDTNMKDV